MPASSPWSRSSTSTLKPCRSAHRVYIRISISAQSWDSVPPAPEWMVSSASRVSSEPRSMFCSSRSEEHTSELQSRFDLVCRLLLEKKKKKINIQSIVRYKYIIDEQQ